MGEIRINIQLLHPQLRNVLQQLEDEFDNLLVYSGYRSYEEQEKEYAKGTTRAHGGYSHHNWGIAFDFCRNTKTDSYNLAYMRTVATRAERLGLASGGMWNDFTDWPHLYLPYWGYVPDQLVRQYGVNGYENFRATWSDNVPIDTGLILVRAGQTHANNFIGAGLDVDGIRGTETRKVAVNIVKQAINLDFHQNLKLDAAVDSGLIDALSKYPIGFGDIQYMVTALQILLLLKNYNPLGVESPGSYGGGLRAAVINYQKENKLKVDGTAGVETFVSLLQ